MPTPNIPYCHTTGKTARVKAFNIWEDLYEDTLLSLKNSLPKYLHDALKSPIKNKYITGYRYIL